MGEADLLKEIARYREELLALAARRPPQAAGVPEKRLESTPSAEVSDGQAEGQEAFSERTGELEKGPLPGDQQVQAAGGQENACGPQAVEKNAESAPPKQAADPGPPKAQAPVREQPQEDVLSTGQEGKERRERMALPGKDEALAALQEQQPAQEQEAVQQAGPTGQLWVRVVTAHGLQPVKGALITVSLVEQQLQTLLTSLYSDTDGRAGCEVPLAPAPAGERPCAYCHIRVDKPGYFTCHAYRVPVYEGEPAAQCARLLPLPGAGRAGHGPRL